MSPCRAESGPSRTYVKRHALVIGINEYEDPGYPDLGYAVADARAVAKIVVEQFQFPEVNVRLLLNQDATHSLIGMPDFEEVSEAIPAKLALFILDCCFGGLAVKRSDPPVAAGLTSRARPGDHRGRRRPERNRTSI